ncbi:MAG: hypothetical protein IKX37_00905 [Bacteroidales bacterium]|nr:hypothetical protein [Bacteroidales bacterium]
MKKYIVLILMALPLVWGCKKAQDSGARQRETSISDGFTFTASMPVTKSHFASESSSQLCWDMTDKVAVFGFPALNLLVRSEGVYTTSVNDVTTISSIYDEGISATLQSAKNGSGWFKDPTSGEIDDPEWADMLEAFRDLYVFYAYYPSNGTPKSVYTDDKSDPNGDYWEYMLFNVPAEQDGQSYDEYQILYDPGLNDQVEGLDMNDLISKSSVLSGNNDISFQFKPITTMLRFTLKLASGEETEMTSLQVSLQGSDAENQSIVGDARLPLILYTPGVGAEGCEPYAGARGNYNEYLRATEGGNNVLTITQFNAKLNAQAASGYYYATLLPFHSTATDMKLKFLTQDTEGRYYVAWINMPEIPRPDGVTGGDTYYGLCEGNRYKTNITLTLVEMNPEAPGAGQYQQGGELTEE